jgi:pimeloyl-ACP methyl ester carboxylesterase
MTFSSALTSTPVVLLPGMMCDDRLFAFQTEQLRKDSQNAVKLYLPQLVYGSSMPELAQYLLAALPSSFCLCGLSMGGILAMEIVAQAPHRVERLALMDTNPLAETKEGVARRNRQINDVKAGKLRQVIAEEMKPHYLAE